MAKNKEVKPKKKWQVLLSKISGGILFALVGLLIVFQFVGVFTASRNNGVPNYGGFMSFRIITDSMEKDNKFTVDTMVFIKKVDVYKLEEGDVITFVRTDRNAYGDNAADRDELGHPYVITHRITVIEEYNGTRAFRTLGDNLNSIYCNGGQCTAANSDYVKADDIFGKVIGQNKALGVLNRVMTKQPLVMAGLVMVPLLVVFGSSLVDLIKQLKNRDKEEAVLESGSAEDSDFEAIKEQEKLKLMIEIEKEKMRQDLAEGRELEELPPPPRRESVDSELEALKEQEKLKLLIEIEKEKMRREMEEEYEKNKK